MLSVANKLFMPSVVMLNVVMLSVIMLNVLAPSFVSHHPRWPLCHSVIASYCVNNFKLGCYVSYKLAHVKYWVQVCLFQLILTLQGILILTRLVLILQILYGACTKCTLQTCNLCKIGRFHKKLPSFLLSVT